MAKTLIIAEKPSLAKNICAAISPAPKWISSKAKNSGYYENDNYVISYAFGHLLQLKDADDYDEDYKQWKIDTLPIIPAKFQYKGPIDAGAKAQLALLKTLISRTDINKIVNAGDSDREGEIIVRNILDAAKNKKPVYRLWMPDQTPKTIKAELAAMKPDSAYDNLANEGYARTYVDWLYGINLTRLASVKTNSYSVCKKALRVGRVTSPIVVAICERERAIRNFKPEKYWVAIHDEDGLKLSSQKKNENKADCSALCKTYNAADTTVTEKTTSRKKLTRPKLFALSDLQGAAGKAYGFSPKMTLDVLQKLYEAGYCTYPRTNSRCMAENEKDKAKDIISAIKSATGKYSDISFRDSKEIFDNSQIEAHSAITPTTVFPKTLSPEEDKLYKLILTRFAAAFCTEEYTVDRTNMTVSNGIEDFKLTGDIMVTPGYTIYEPTKKSTLLPPLNKGDHIKPAFENKEKETTPPDHYTADSLNAYLKNPYSAKEKKDLSSDADAKEVIGEVELGTEATRAGLIDAAIKSGYITFGQNRYGITDLGEFYVDSLTALGIDMTKGRTLELSKSLKLVYRGDKAIAGAVTDAEDDLRSIVTCGKSAKPVSTKLQNNQETKKKGSITMIAKDFCKCPKCGGTIVENDKAFGCKDRECGCVVFKDDHYLARFKKPMTAAIAKSLLTRGFADIEGLISAKTGKPFNARLYASFDEKYPSYSLNFDEYGK